MIANIQIIMGGLRNGNKKTRKLDWKKGLQASGTIKIIFVYTMNHQRILLTSRTQYFCRHPLVPSLLVAQNGERPLCLSLTALNHKYVGLFCSLSTINYLKNSTMSWISYSLHTSTHNEEAWTAVATAVGTCFFLRSQNENSIYTSKPCVSLKP